jgi:hypothetical protein
MQVLVTKAVNVRYCTHGTTSQNKTTCRVLIVLDRKSVLTAAFSCIQSELHRDPIVTLDSKIQDPLIE